MAEPTTPPDPSPALERRLATILAADVAGFSRMMGDDEEATVQTLRSHRSVFDALLAQHHGRVFNTAGDMILAEFPSAVEAVRAATEIQAALQTRNEHLPPERKMLFRMGINLGDVVVQQGDLLGDGVNVAARIQTVAPPGGVCISGSVYDQIQNKLSLHFQPMGDQKFKNIGQPVRTFTITNGDAGALPSPRRKGQGIAPWAVTLGVLAALAVAGGGYWVYRDNETKRSEQASLAGQLAAQKQAVDDARRAAEDQSRRATEAEARAERERLAAEASKREADLQAQLAAAKAARNRSGAASAAAAAGTPRAAVAAAAAPTATAAAAATAAPAPTPPAGPAAVGRREKYDGTWSGPMCNFPANPIKRTCWNVSLDVRQGAGRLSWANRPSGKESHASIAVAPNGAVTVALDGWNARDGTPLPGTMTGRIVDDRLDVRGRWDNAVLIDGHLSRAH